MNIYVVMGSRGEYSDREEYSICAYYDENLAKQHVIGAEDFNRFNKLAVENYSKTHPRRYDNCENTKLFYEFVNKLRNPYDTEYGGYDGTYWYETVPIVENLPILGD